MILPPHKMYQKRRQDMFIYSFKGQNLKLIAALFLSAAIVCSVFFYFPSPGESTIVSEEVLPAIQLQNPGDFKNIKTNEDRIAFLKLFGWEVEQEAVEVAEVIIPLEFDSVYQKYNEIQSGEGLNLEKYKGKSVRKYTYLVRNYEYDGSVYANLLIYKDRVIGGDICSAKQNGFIHGFSKQNNIGTDGK
jgi:hypothetical protein